MNPPGMSVSTSVLALLLLVAFVLLFSWIWPVLRLWWLAW